MKINTRIKIEKAAICVSCEKRRRIFIGECLKKVWYKGTTLQYPAIICFCKKCHQEVEPVGAWDENLLRIQEAYHEYYNK